MPRGGGKKARKLKLKDGRILGMGGNELNDIVDHWSRHEKYDGDLLLESNYRKHLGRHANK